MIEHVVKQEKIVPAPLVVCRYPNRKLYAKEQSRYVTLAILYEELMTGRSIEVRCYKSEVDVTSQVLSLIYHQVCVASGHVAPEHLEKSIRDNEAAAAAHFKAS